MAAQPRSPLGSVFATVITVALAVILAACGGEAPAAPVGDAVLEQGRELYVRNCAGCHGLAGGGATGPALSNGASAEVYPEVQDQIDIVVNGRNNMPAFGGRLTDEEIEAVVRYTREVL